MCTALKVQGFARSPGRVDARGFPTQQKRVYPYPLGTGSARPNPNMGAPDPENPLFLGVSVLRGGLRPWSQKGPDRGVGVDPESGFPNTMHGLFSESVALTSGSIYCTCLCVASQAEAETCWPVPFKAYWRKVLIMQKSPQLVATCLQLSLHLVEMRVVNLQQPLNGPFLIGPFPAAFQEVKWPLRTKSGNGPMKVGKRPIKEVGAPTCSKSNRKSLVI